MFVPFTDPLLLAVASDWSTAIITNNDFTFIQNINGYTDLELALADVSEAPVLLIESNSLEGVLSGRNVLETVCELLLMEYFLRVFTEFLVVFCDIWEVKRTEISWFVLELEPTHIQYWIEMWSKRLDRDGRLIVDIDQRSVLPIVESGWSIEDEPLDLLVDGLELIFTIKQETIEKLMRITIELIVVIWNEFDFPGLLQIDVD